MNAAIVAAVLSILIMIAALSALIIGAWHSERRANQRIRDIEAEGRWLRTKNRAATNKDTGAGFAGYHSPRRRRRN